MKSDDLVSVYSVANPMEAEIIRAELNAEGIACQIDNENQAALTGITAMEIQILTRAEDADRARKLLLSHERNR
jgi:hypothetical protein